MKENDKVNLFIQYLIRVGKFASQEDVGKFLGYDNKSSFSQILKKDITPIFREKFISSFPEFENFNIGIGSEKVNDDVTGDMLNEEKAHNDVSVSTEDIQLIKERLSLYEEKTAFYKEKIETLEKENKELKKAKEFLVHNAGVAKS